MLKESNGKGNLKDKSHFSFSWSCPGTVSSAAVNDEPRTGQGVEGQEPIGTVDGARRLFPNEVSVGRALP